MTTAGTLGDTSAARPWVLAARWLLFLGPFFYLTYGTANWLAGQSAQVGSVVFEWERALPFVAWTIVPYWSVNAFYAASLFVCRNAAEVNALGRRLLTAQVVAVTCFILFPLTFTFTRPETSGVPSLLFAALAGFDKPFNQAPSLHIALLVILWAVYAKAIPATWRWLLHGWFTLVGVSVLTTYQHHFIDIPTGALLGFFSLWLWPAEAASPLAHAQWTQDPKRKRLAAYYAVGAASCFALAGLGGWALWFCWPGVSLSMVGLFYLAVGEGGFQKGPDGRMSAAARWLLAPYLAAARLNSAFWTARRAAAGPEVADGVHVGSLRTSLVRFSAVVDLCAELSHTPGAARYYIGIPVLDLTVPSDAQLRAAVQAIEAARVHGSVLVCCALGYSRSVSAVVAWLRATGRADSVAAAVAMVRRVRPQLVLSPAHLAAIEQAAS